MQHLKSKFSQSALPETEQNTEKKSGIKEIICPDSCAPIWQQAFALADNVRFTRTPDSEIIRRRAAIDPEFAKILAKAEADLKADKAKQKAKKAEQEPMPAPIIADQLKASEYNKTENYNKKNKNEENENISSPLEQNEQLAIDETFKDFEHNSITDGNESSVSNKDQNNNGSILSDSAENQEEVIQAVSQAGDSEVKTTKEDISNQDKASLQKEKPLLHEVKENDAEIAKNIEQATPVANMREQIVTRFQSVPSHPEQMKKINVGSKAIASKGYGTLNISTNQRNYETEAISNNGTQAHNAVKVENINQQKSNLNAISSNPNQEELDTAAENLDLVDKVSKTSNADHKRVETKNAVKQNRDSFSERVVFPWQTLNQPTESIKTEEGQQDINISDTEHSDMSSASIQTGAHIPEHNFSSMASGQTSSIPIKHVGENVNTAQNQFMNEKTIDTIQSSEQMDITRLFKAMECRQPQMRWIAVPAEIADSFLSDYMQANQNSNSSASPIETHETASNYVHKTVEPDNKVLQKQDYASDQSDIERTGYINNGYAFSNSVLNMQFKINNFSATQNVKDNANTTPKEQANSITPETETSSLAQNNQSQIFTPPQSVNTNLDALCSSAVENVNQNDLQSSHLMHNKIEDEQAQSHDVEQDSDNVAKSEPMQVDSLPDRHARPTLQPKQKIQAPIDYELPFLELLQEPSYHDGSLISQEVLERSAGLLESVLEDFGVKGEIIHVRPGPVVTLYEFEPAPGVKSSRVIGLSEDIARSMSSIAARVAVIPGRNVIGIELPNKKRETVYLREILQSKAYKTSNFKLPLALGKNIGGEPIIAELAKMPHLLVAGTTGSGKSVAINTMILSLLYRMSPEQCRLIMVDPKMLELSVYDGIPHLLTPVVTDPKKALSALKWAVREMEDRYRKMAKLGVRNIDGFNARVKEAVKNQETIMCTVQAGFDKETGELQYREEAMDLKALPYIVIIVDEMADLMMVAGKEIEGAIQRLAQMARAAGIHLIMATQRPSVDVITGTIKANFPTRISFQVTSKVDSRTILGEQGAEVLLGQGDMLHMAGGGRLKRVHGPFVSDQEVEKVVAHLKTQGTPEYLATVTESNDDESAEHKGKVDSETAAAAEVIAEVTGHEETDDLYIQAVKIVMRDKKCSTSYIQRRLSIGYNKAATLVEKMEDEGLVGEANHVGKREILISTDD